MNEPNPTLTHIAPMSDYLTPSKYIDFQEPIIQTWLADRPRPANELETIDKTFRFVRDEVSHSWDIQSRRITVKASEALEHREGICYAKSHLLAALLRAQGVPAGLCYQRLTLGDTPETGYAVHSLNTVYVAGLDRWIRLDARGNKPGVDAQFSVDAERLAFAVRNELDEQDYRVNHAEPHPKTVEALEAGDDCRVVYSVSLPSRLD